MTAAVEAPIPDDGDDDDDDMQATKAPQPSVVSTSGFRGDHDNPRAGRHGSEVFQAQRGWVCRVIEDG